MELFETLKLLTEAHGVSGREAGVRAVLLERVRGLCDEHTVDVMGDLICHRKGPGPRVMLSAPMDTAGVVISHIQPDGYLRFAAVGGLAARQLAGRTVRLANGMTGLIAVTPDKAGEDFTVSDLYLDVGAGGRGEAEHLVALGDTAAFHVPAEERWGRVLASGLSSRAPCAALLTAMEELSGSPNDLYFVFTAQSRTGLRGVKTAAYAVDPDYAVVVDATAADDVPEADHRGSCVLGAGAAVKVMDGAVICHPRAIALLDGLAARRGIPAQREVYKAGRSDAGAVCTTRVGVLTGGVSVPVRHLNNPAELVQLSDLRACADLIKAFAESELENV